MLFMGEEWGARTPWQFFSDHEGELGEAVREGRRAEFASHGWDADGRARPADAGDVPRLHARLEELDGDGAQALLAWTRD